MTDAAETRKTDIWHAAAEARDPRFDGVFYTGVRTTGIYCRCVCPARMPLRKNRTYYPSAAAAEKAGYRPCLLCRPELAPGHAPIDHKARLATQALSRIESGALEEQGLEELASDLGVTSRHLRRATADVFGASPIDLAQTHRLLTAKRLLTETALPVTEIAFASGFRSLRRFNALFLERYGFPPSRLRERRGSAPAAPTLSLDLVARGVFDGTAHLDFFCQRALAGMERVENGAYVRTLRIGAHSGWVRITPTSRGVTLELAQELSPALRPLVAAVRGAFDLDCDVEAIDRMLGDDPVLDVAGAPGVRVQGGLDPFEIAIRAVLGQQVTLGAACTLAQRVVSAFGADIETGVEGLTKLFPTAQTLAGVDASEIARLGMPLSRAETVTRVAGAVAEGKLVLARGAIAAGRAGLAALSGVGPWTVEYVALRGLGDPDAFPAGDSALCGVLGVRAGVEHRAEPWRPWRSYAAVRLWRRHAAAAASKSSKSKKDSR